MTDDPRTVLNLSWADDSLTLVVSMSANILASGGFYIPSVWWYTTWMFVGGVICPTTTTTMHLVLRPSDKQQSTSNAQSASLISILSYFSKFLEWYMRYTWLCPPPEAATHLTGVHDSWDDELLPSRWWELKQAHDKLLELFVSPWGERRMLSCLLGVRCEDWWVPLASSLRERGCCWLWLLICDWFDWLIWWLTVDYVPIIRCLGWMVP